MKTVGVWSSQYASVVVPHFGAPIMKKFGFNSCPPAECRQDMGPVEASRKTGSRQAGGHLRLPPELQHSGDSPRVSTSIIATPTENPMSGIG